MTGKQQQHIYIKGMVQGVFFRAATKKIADRKHLKGWVKNLDNGDVEICIEGSKQDAEDLIEELKKEPGPKIHSAKVQSAPLQSPFFSFDIVY